MSEGRRTEEGEEICRIYSSRGAGLRPRVFSNSMLNAGSLKTAEHLLLQLNLIDVAGEKLVYRQLVLFEQVLHE